jgi:lipid-binding SYLF domain-containing protein
MKRFFLSSLAALMIFSFFTPAASAAKSAREIDVKVDDALSRFQLEVPGGSQMLKNAKGVLVFPKVLKAGIGLGGEYGTGALRVNGKTIAYYNTMTASVGFQLGGQVKSVYLLFMADEALKSFQSSEGWKAGVDGSIALITIGADGSVDTTKTDQPILGFVLGQKGLMYNLTLEGSKYNKIETY